MMPTTNQPLFGVRAELGKLLGERHVFKAVFIRSSTRALKYNPTDNSEDYVDTYLFRQLVVTTTNQTVAEHIWCDSSPLLREANLKPGNIVELDSEVTSYVRMLRGEGGTSFEKDYALLPLHRVTVIGQEKSYVGRNGQKRGSKHGKSKHHSKT